MPASSEISHLRIPVGFAVWDTVACFRAVSCVKRQGAAVRIQENLPRGWAVVNLLKKGMERKGGKVLYLPYFPN